MTAFTGAVLFDHPNIAAINRERIYVFALVSDALNLRVRPLQCICTPESIPDGMRLVPFNTMRKPSDTIEDWSAIVVLKDMSFTLLQYSVDVYDGPKGLGYIISAQVAYEYNIWSYSQHYGGESRLGSFGVWSVVDARGGD